MAEEPNQIKQHIDTTRKELDGNLHELEHRVKDATNWRTYVNRYPLAMAGLAFAGGTVVSLWLGGPTRRSNGRHDGNHDAVFVEKERQSGHVWDIVKSAIVGVAANQIKAVLNEAIPGFRHQYEHMRRERAAGSAHPAASPVL